MKTIYRIFGAIGLLSLLSACNGESDWENALHTDNYLQIEGEVVGNDMATKATMDPLGISYSVFETGDDIGFFSYHSPDCEREDDQREHDKTDDTDYFKNERLVYSNDKFISDEIKNIPLSRLGLTFAYFPYADIAQSGPDGYTKADGNPLAENEHYIHIFKDGNIVDLLTASKIQYADVNYKFHHKFAMLLLYLGEGFSTENNTQLTVHLTEKILGAHITRKRKGAFPYEDFEFTVDKVSKSNSVEGSSFVVYRKEPTGERVVYPLILPEGVEIDYIEVKDITGVQQKVKPTKEALPELKGEWKYPLTIQMEGITPTVYPHEIIPWGKPTEIKVDKTFGIYTDVKFQEWLDLYNKCNGNLPTDAGSDEFKALTEFGEYNDSEEPRGWRFYLRDNIDCSRITATNGVLINTLTDRVMLDGGNNILSNLKLEVPSDGKAGLIGKIEGGDLRNLRLEFVTVTNAHSGSPAGCIAAEISGGQILNCTVKNAFMSCKKGGPSGVLAGKMTGGIVDNCKFHGTVLAPSSTGDQTYKGIVGEITGGGSLSNITNRVIFDE
ncbi:fimbrillin family protein [Parabacteroides faecis]|uniref:fimbrillin family protein n=1 Tax=Parabacteroides faecis TaxID=1217282 RepID=UPI0021643B72|nr:fimbrillin family protein [Parabacteroides faecis]MCS2892350.1 fimbrillin family protein [Parabacteroides faecis]UVQ49010.1 fimbrillin family protein [Parabacteroides faecis]